MRRQVRRAKLAISIVLCAGALAWAPAIATEPTVSPWTSLTATQKTALAPLKDDWVQIDNARRQKWIELANRFPRIPAEERERIQQRMTDWSRMSTADRGRARLAFQQSRDFSAGELQARWQAYQALPDEERQRLASQSRPAPRSAAVAPTALARASQINDSGKSAKRNVVSPTSTSAVRTVAPSMVQAKPGATTSPVNKTAAPPSHTQPGLPKVAATPNFVDPATLLPRRGAQAAAMAARPGGRPNVE
jgi:Protein of unknown function (DUF3106)